MKTSLLKLFIAVLLALPAMSNAQTPINPIVYKDWVMIDESPTMLDVSYRVIKCTSVNQIHLMVFNENNFDQTANFELEVTNTKDGLKFTKAYNFATQKATIYKADCDSEPALEKLKIDLPAGYDPTNLTVKITFK
ncbi:MAG: hypothetical protein Q8K64_06975 [Sediminibacterium sp.]|nr:hypothetical protein [Sediminibacterium sp.]